MVVQQCLSLFPVLTSLCYDLPPKIDSLNTRFVKSQVADGEPVTPSPMNELYKGMSSGSL